MTVSELIEALKKMPQHLTVLTSDDPGDGYNFTVGDVRMMQDDPTEEEYSDPMPLVEASHAEAEYVVIMPQYAMHKGL